MKIALATTHTGLIENKRIEEEVKALGHKFELIDLSGFNYFVENNELKIKGLTDTDADVVIFRGIFLSLKAIAAVAEGLRAKGVKIFDNSLLKHKYSINKITDFVLLANKKVSMPKAYYSRNFDDYLKVGKKLKYPLIVKLTRAGKGAGIYKMDNEEELEAFISQAQENGYKGASYIMQEYIPYVHDLRILVIGGKMFTMKRIPKEGDFRANFSLGGSVELFKPDVETQDLALKALKAVDMTVGGVDVLIDKENKKYILEVNHTAGMVGMEEATGENITQIYVKHVIEKAK